MRNEKKEHMIRIISKIAWEVNTVHPDKAFMLLLGRISAYNEILRKKFFEDFLRKTTLFNYAEPLREYLGVNEQQ